jgi:hypothetical protein
MTTVQLLSMQLSSVHKLQEDTFADVDHNSAHFSEVGKAYPVGAAYVHSVRSEDIILSMITDKEVLNPGEDIGLSEPMPSFAEFEKNEAWMKNVRVDLAKFKSYAERVYSATATYIASLR